MILGALYFIFNITLGEKIDVFGTFLLLLFAFWIIQGLYTGVVFGEFSSKARTQQLLVLPALKAEIFWSKFLSSFVVFPVFYVLYALLVLKLGIEYNKWIAYATDYPEEYIRYHTLQEFWNSNEFNEKIINQAFVFLTVFFASCVLWGVMTFKKLAFLKSVAYWFFVILFSWFALIFIYFIISGNYTWSCFPFVVIEEDRGAAEIFEWYPNLVWIILSAISLILIVISRIKFNEKTI